MGIHYVAAFLVWNLAVSHKAVIHGETKVSADEE
jgi:hypothetical protein